MVKLYKQQVRAVAFPGETMQARGSLGKEDNVFILKGCPKCRGDVYLERDHYGAYLACLQCGYLVDQEHESGPLTLRIVPPVGVILNEPR